MNVAGKALLITAVFTVVSALSCAGSETINLERSHIISPKDIEILRKTTEALEFDFGYHSDIDLIYVHKFSQPSKSLPVRERELGKVLASYPADEIKTFYSRVIRLHMALEHKSGFYRSIKDWKNYTYFRNYLIPPMEEFRELVKKQVMQRDPSLMEMEKRMEARGKSWAAWYYRDSEVAVDTFP